MREVDGLAVVGSNYAEEPGIVPGEVREFLEDGPRRAWNPWMG